MQAPLNSMAPEDPDLEILFSCSREVGFPLRRLNHAARVVQVQVLPKQNARIFIFKKRNANAMVVDPIVA